MPQPETSRRALAAAALLGIGVTALVIVGREVREQSAGRVPRPKATGETGLVSVYAQAPGGPTLIWPGVERTWPRPQDLAFTWSALGTGPRRIRIELETGGARALAHAEEVQAPGRDVALAYVLHLDASAPDRLAVIVTVEAPHARSFASRYPLRLR